MCRDCRSLEPTQEFSLCPQCVHTRKLALLNVGRTAGTTPEVGEDLADETVQDGTSEPKSVLDYLPSIKSILLSPTRFFSAMHSTDNLRHAITFALVFGVIGALFTLAWAPLMPQTDASLLEAQELSGLSRTMVVLALMVLLPIASALEVLLYTGGIHLMMRWVTPNRGRFVTTLKVVCYAMASKVLMAVPMAGQILTLVFFVSVLMIGVRVVYRLPFNKSLIAVGVPILVVASLGLASLGG
ncbi:MAG: hypothetical protein AUK47_11420 [Deltaproteobacteria bacterium CG2_30_63_29]|nr:MAG: hypothetical protein AUK47_11420 [Deltaproteobacteria bacterium CG2_30_63_29]PJB49268.1 MAG: hypothetical protein CO108_00330 [Deltaproteobacteria bacterium CG_4_9_14_3_um_filter_63_12]